MRFTEAVQKAGVSYRQADHWAGQRWIDAPGGGSGTVREIGPREAMVLARMGTLVRVGVTPAAAAGIARAAVEQHTRAVDLPGGLRLVFDVPARAAS